MPLAKKGFHRCSSIAFLMTWLSLTYSCMLIPGFPFQNIHDFRTCHFCNKDFSPILFVWLQMAKNSCCKVIPKLLLTILNSLNKEGWEYLEPMHVATQRCLGLKTMTRKCHYWTMWPSNVQFPICSPAGLHKQWTLSNLHLGICII